MLSCHEKNALCDRYIVEFIHDATENYCEGGTYTCRNCNNIKFPLYVLKILKLHLFRLPMLVDSCFQKLFAHKIPMHRKWVRLKFASHMLHHALLHVSIHIFYASIIIGIIMPSLKGIKEKRLLGDNPTLLPPVFVCSHDYSTVLIMFYCFCFNKVPCKAFGIMLGDS